MFELLFLALAAVAVPEPVCPSWTAETILKASEPVVQEFKNDKVKGWKVILDVKKKDFPNGIVPNHFEVYLTVDPETWKSQGDIMIDGKVDDRYGLFHVQDQKHPNLHMFYINGIGEGVKDGGNWGDERCDRDPPDADFQIQVFLYSDKEELPKPKVSAKAYSNPNLKVRSPSVREKK